MVRRINRDGTRSTPDGSRTSRTAGILRALELTWVGSFPGIHERTTRYALADLQRELEYRCVAGINSDTVDECFKRLQSLLGASGEKWNKGIARQPSSGDKA